MTESVEPTREERIQELARRLNPDAFKARIHDWTRGGFSSSSMGQGSPSAEKPDPHLDPRDFEFNMLLTSYGRELANFNRSYLAGRWNNAEQALRRAERIEACVLVEDHMSEEQLEEYRAAAKKGPRGLKCGNPNCKHKIMGGKKDPLLHGRCRNCGRYWAAHNGVDRSVELCERELNREIEAAVVKAVRESA